MSEIDLSRMLISVEEKIEKNQLGNKLTNYEKVFLRDTKEWLDQGKLCSEKQAAKLEEIARKVDYYIFSQTTQREEQRRHDESRSCLSCEGNLWELWEHKETKEVLSRRCHCVGGQSELIDILNKPDIGDSYRAKQQARNVEAFEISFAAKKDQYERLR